MSDCLYAVISLLHNNENGMMIAREHKYMRARISLASPSIRIRLLRYILSSRKMGAVGCCSLESFALLTVVHAACVAGSK